MDAIDALAAIPPPSSLSILSLAEPYLVLPSPNAANEAKRSSNASSTDSRSGATPAILSADLVHYRELFSKLHFSYVEQVTKERFLRAITADQPRSFGGGDQPVAVFEEQLVAKALPSAGK